MHGKHTTDDRTHTTDVAPEWTWLPAWKRNDTDPVRDPRSQADETRPAQPDGSAPLERDLAPINQKR